MMDCEQLGQATSTFTGDAAEESVAPLPNATTSSFEHDDNSTMTCEHLRQLETELSEAGYHETFRGKAWSANCREWIYFDCYFDKPSIRKRIALADCVVDHEHLGTHNGQEAGFVCSQCHDAIMGVHPRNATQKTPVYG